MQFVKFIAAIFLTALAAYAIGLFTLLPWYSFVFTTLIVAVAIHQKPIKAFFAGFLGLFMLWALIAFIKNTANNSILAGKVANILPLQGNAFLLIIITGLVGGLVAGFAALTGSYLRKSIS